MKITRIVTILLMSLVSVASLAKTTWRELSKGLAYTQITLPTLTSSGTIHAFRVDLKQFELSLALANEYQGQFASAQNLTQASKGVLGINGGFFSPELESLGLRISDGEQLSRLKKTPWWGIFLIENGVAKILAADQYHARESIDFAIQCGPRLLVNGRIPKLRPGVANRSVLGIRRDGQVIIAATQNIYLSTEELAKIFQRSEEKDGLACRQALNLDGGSSTQLYAKVDNFQLSLTSFMPVADVVVVLPRSPVRAADS